MAGWYARLSCTSGWCVCTRECLARARSPRIRSAPQSRLALAISWIKATVCWEILGLVEGDLDLPTGCATRCESHPFGDSMRRLSQYIGRREKEALSFTEVLHALTHLHSHPKILSASNTSSSPRAHIICFCRVKERLSVLCRTLFAPLLHP